MLAGFALFSGLFPSGLCHESWGSIVRLTAVLSSGLGRLTSRLGVVIGTQNGPTAATYTGCSALSGWTGSEVEYANPCTPGENYGRIRRTQRDVLNSKTTMLAALLAMSASLCSWVRRRI